MAKKCLLLPLIVLLAGCNYLPYDSGWLPANERGGVDAKIMQKITKSDAQFIDRRANDYNDYIDSFTGDEFSNKFGVSYSLRQQTNKMWRLQIENGIKRIYLAEFSGVYRDVYTIRIPKD